MAATPGLRVPVRGEKAKTCSKCGRQLPSSNFLKKRSVTSTDGLFDWCNDCITEYLEQYDYDWDIVDDVCRELDIPFVPARFEDIRKVNKVQPFVLYSQLLNEEEYCDIGWREYYKEFKKLKDAGIIESELPLLREEERRALKEKWGPNYDDEALNYLENLHRGLLKTQNVAGSLQDDQSLKLCKISYEIDQRIESGEEIDKMLGSYSKLVDIAQFTPKHAKNANDFDSVGEIFKWCEKRGWKNQYYNNVSKDIVDETMANIQNFNRKLWVNESGLGEEVEKRLELIKITDQKEQYYDVQEVEDFDKYDNEGFDNLEKAFEEEDFVVEGGETI